MFFKNGVGVTTGIIVDRHLFFLVAEYCCVEIHFGRTDGFQRDSIARTVDENPAYEETIRKTNGRSVTPPRTG